MKFLRLVMLAAAVSLGGSAFADTTAPQSPPMVIKNAVGNLTVTGRILNPDGTYTWQTVTLKPGDKIPDFDPNPPADTPPPSVTVTAGSVDMQIGGKTVTAGAGATFTVSNTNGVVAVSATGAPVTVKTESGHNVVVTAGSAVNMTTTTNDQGQAQVAIAVTQGSAKITDSTGQPVGGREDATVTAGSDPVEVSGAYTEPAATDTTGPRIVQPITTETTDSRGATESGSVSGSNP